MDGKCDWTPCNRNAIWLNKNVPQKPSGYKDFEYCQKHASEVRLCKHLRGGSWSRIFIERRKEKQNA